MTAPPIVFAIPGDPETRTGGYIYDRRVMAALAEAGVATRLLRLPDGYPHPDDDAVARTQDLLGGVDPGATLIVDGLCWGAFPAERAEAVVKARAGALLALCHHPLGLEAGLDAQRRAALIENERRTLALAHGVIVTSTATRDTLVAEFDTPAQRIVVAEPGVDPAPRAQGSQDNVVRLLAVGAIVPRKGYDVLVDALARLRDLQWWLVIVGSAQRAPACAAALAAQIARHDLGARVTLAGEQDEEALARLYADSDVFVSASLYEGYGMVLTEALARGLPLVCTTGGAAALTAPDAASIKVSPGDSAALADALRAIIADASLRATLADAAWAHAAHLPRWTDTARGIADAVATLATGDSGARARA